MAGIPFFVRPLPFAVSSVGNERSDRPASNLGEFQYTGMVWRSNGAASLTFRATLSAATTCDFVGLLNTNAITATDWQVVARNAGATIVFDSGVIDLISPAVTGRDFYQGHCEFPAASVLTVDITITSHTGDFEAAFLVIGKKVSGARYYETQWESGPEDLSSITISRNGVPEIAAGSMLRSKAFTLGWISEAEYEGQFQPLMQTLGKTSPVYLCFDPEPTTYRQARTYFGYMRDTRRFKKAGFNRFEKSFELLSKI